MHLLIKTFHAKKLFCNKCPFLLTKVTDFFFNQRWIAITENFFKKKLSFESFHDSLYGSSGNGRDRRYPNQTQFLFGIHPSFKGRIHLHFSNLIILNRNTDLNELLQTQKLDKFNYSNFKVGVQWLVFLWNSNSIKLEILEIFQPKLSKFLSKLMLKLEKFIYLNLNMCLNSNILNSMKLEFEKKMSSFKHYWNIKQSH